MATYVNGEIIPHWHNVSWRRNANKGLDIKVTTLEEQMADPFYRITALSNLINKLLDVGLTDTERAFLDEHLHEDEHLHRYYRHRVLGEDIRVWPLPRKRKPAKQKKARATKPKPASKRARGASRKRAA